MADCTRTGTQATRNCCDGPEITADLMMHAGSCMSKDKAHGPEDIIVSEIIRESPAVRSRTASVPDSEDVALLRVLGALCSWCS